MGGGVGEQQNPHGLLNRRSVCADSNTNEGLSQKEQQVWPESCELAMADKVGFLAAQTDSSFISRCHVPFSQSKQISQ